MNIETAISSLDSVDVCSKPPTTSSDALLCFDDIMSKLTSRTKIHTTMSAAQVQKQDMMTSSVTFVKAETTRKLGQNTFLSGGTYLADGRLVMADYQNRRLVQLNEEYNIVNEYKIDHKPMDVTAGNNDEGIYITVFDGLDDFIYKCTLDTELAIISEIRAPSGTLTITVSGDNIIVGTHTAIVILNQDGSTVKSIPKSGVNCYVSVSQMQGAMYHKDNNEIVCRTLEGKEQFRYKHQQLQDPGGICQDQNNCLYICGTQSHNVHQVSPDGKRNRILLEKLHNISMPQSVVFHPQKNEFVVTSNHEDTVLEVYRLG